MFNSSILKIRELGYGHFVFLIFLFAHGVPATYIPTTAQNSTNSTLEATGTQPETDVLATIAPPSDLGRADFGTTTPPNSSTLNLTVAIGAPNSLDSHEALKLSDGGDKKRVHPGEMLQSQFRVYCNAATQVFRMNPDPAAYPRFLETRRGEYLPTLASRPNYQEQVASGSRSETAVRKHIRRVVFNRCLLCSCDQVTGELIANPESRPVPGSRALFRGCPPGDQTPEMCMSWYNCRCNAVVAEFGARAAIAPRPMDGPGLIQSLVDPTMGVGDAGPVPNAEGRTDPFQHLLDAVNMAIAADTLDGLADSRGPPLYGPQEPNYKYGGPSGSYDGPDKGGFFGGGYNPYGGGGTGSGSGLGLKKKSEIQPPLNEMEDS
ncbi:hypothetical protein TWF788_008192 [Orbilia oligospora]|uniref:Uncharacterized protein n=1 Tax=Orbilia oligospora TaxID=2813651 RepID=A0A7C8Q347_ORBOL|nr:hypothetical protein TWF788_008192 [Orbilia oligospora]